MREMERGVVEAAQEDNLTFYSDLRRVIDAHPLIDKETQARYDLNPQVFFTFQYAKSLNLPIVLSRPSSTTLLQRLALWMTQLPKTVM